MPMTSDSDDRCYLQEFTYDIVISLGSYS